MVLIDFYGSLYIPADNFNNFHPFTPFTGPIDVHFGPKQGQKRPEINYFHKKWRLKVDNLDQKWFESIFMIVCTSLQTILTISIHLHPSSDLQTFISGPKRARTRQKLTIFTKNGGSRSIISIRNGLNRFLWQFVHPYRQF